MCDFADFLAIATMYDSEGRPKRVSSSSLNSTLLIIHRDGHDYSAVRSVKWKKDVYSIS